MSVTNPLLVPCELPPFDAIAAHHVEPAVTQVLAEAEAAVAALLESQPDPPTWQSLALPLAAIEETIHHVWAPVGHLNGVMNSPELREAVDRCQPMITDYYSRMGQNARLYQRWQQLRESDAFAALEAAAQRSVENTLRDFRLSGVALPPAEQEIYRQISSELSQLATRFGNQILDATHAWHKHVADEALLAGIPASSRAMMAQAAAAAGESGWRINLDFPSYSAVLTYAEDRALREELYTAWSTRASDQGPHGKEWDNGPLMVRILALRQQKARLLGFANYAEYALATRMARDPAEVLQFLRDLAARSRPLAQQELDEITGFARQQGFEGPLAAWDISFYAERLRQQRYAITQEELRPWFPLPQVLRGLFALIERLFGIAVREDRSVAVWHADVTSYTLHDRQGTIFARCYLDPYARQHKRGGAWMDDAQGRWRRGDGTLQMPIAWLVCNFTPPLKDQPALLTHNEVVTLLHEFGHGMHHLLTQVDVASVAGINGVAWDAVELPSQLLENWCWQREALDMMAAHYETGEPLPQNMLSRMVAAKNFQAGMQMVRQLEFALFDFLLHLESGEVDSDRIAAIIAAVRQEVAVVVPPAWNRFQHSFSHIFSGGYAAGYYSYKWAEVLSADAFARFEEEGILNPTTGESLRSTVLAQGGSRDPMELFIAFRGRPPSIDALLRHSGIAA
jgi:oligopeptidase A